MALRTRNKLVIFSRSGAAWFYIMLLFLLSLCLLPGAGHAETRFGASTALIKTATGAYHFTLEVANTADARTQGLMFRKSIAPDAGMMFEFSPPRPVSMWMRNTLIPLDMIFIDSTGVVLSVAENTKPQSLDLIEEARPTSRVIEVKAGTARRIGLKAGDHVESPVLME